MLNLQRKVNPRNFSFLVRQLFTGTADGNGGGANTLDLQTTDAVLAALPDDALIGYRAMITGGAGAFGEIRRIVDFIDASDRIVVDKNWSIAVDATTQYAVFLVLTDQPFKGLAQGAGDRFITLAATEPAIDDFFNHLDLHITHGLGKEAREMSRAYRAMDYDGALRRLYIGEDWDVEPDGTSRYWIEGHLYHPLTSLNMDLKSGGNLRVTKDRGGLAFGGEDLGPSVPEEDLANVPYLEIASEAASATLQIHRTE